MKLIHRVFDEFSFKRDRDTAVTDFLKKEFDIDAEYDYRGFLVHKGTHDRISNFILRDINCPNNEKPLSEVIGNFLEKMKIDKENYATVTEYDVLKICLSAHGYAYFICADNEGKVRTFNDTDENIRVFREAKDNKNIE